VNDATLKINWAEDHIEQLNSDLRTFLKGDPYKISSKRNLDTQEIVYYLAEKRDVPPDIRLLAGDIFQNLRTALDYAVCTIIRSRNGSINGNIGFPIFDDEPVTPKDQARFLGKIKGAGDAAIDYIRAVKPYKTGNEVLWRLHRLNIIDKHRLLLTTGLAMHEFNISQHMRATRTNLDRPIFGSPDMWVAPRGKLILHNVGDDLVIDPATSKVNEDIQFKFTVALNESGVVEGEPLIQVARQAMDWVNGVTLDLSHYIVK
jgi:hypothetical protein